jgi:hypothetical protein
MGRIANTGENFEILRTLFLAGISFPKKHSGIFFWSLLLLGKNQQNSL